VQELEELKNKYNTQVQLMSANNNSPKVEQPLSDDDEMTQKYVDLKVRVHELEENNESLYQQLLLKDNEIEKLIISTPTSPPADDNINTIQPLNNEYSGNDVYGKYDK
jgi:hypothetical protein